VIGDTVTVKEITTGRVVLEENTDNGLETVVVKVESPPGIQASDYSTHTSLHGAIYGKKAHSIQLQKNPIIIKKIGFR
jgi:hypothetical protein